MIQEADQITHAWRQSPVARIQPAEVILVTDFDGTLAEIVQDPAGAGARPEALAALEELVRLLADVIVLSSRPLAQLENLVPLSGVRLIGDSGLAIPRHALREALDRFNADAGKILERIPGSLIEASSDLGGRSWRTLRSVIMPLALPGIAAGSIFTFSLTLGDYIMVDLVGGNKTDFLGSVIFRYQGIANDLPLAAAIALVPVAVITIYLLLVRQLGAFEAL